MASSFGNRIKVTLFGESHGPVVGMVLDGLPAGEAVDLNQLASFCARRSPGNQPGSTTRREPDTPEWLSGLKEGMTTGSPLAALIRNTQQHSNAYEALKDIPRPGHADFPRYVKHGGYQDHRGGGHSSGRLTAPLCLAGGIALQVLERQGVKVAARLVTVGDIEAARAEGDSVGGVVECVATGLPIGLGEPPFDGVENRLAQVAFGIPAVRGIEFGAGFAAAGMRGSEHNDGYFFDRTLTGQAQNDPARVRTFTNNHGGVLGGLTTGMPLIFKLAFKPTPSIAREQQSVNLATGAEVPLVIEGRHDVCLAPRAVPVVEAVCGLVLLDLLYEAQQAFAGSLGKSLGNSLEGHLDSSLEGGEQAGPANGARLGGES